MLKCIVTTPRGKLPVGLLLHYKILYDIIILRSQELQRLQVNIKLSVCQSTNTWRRVLKTRFVKCRHLPLSQISQSMQKGMTDPGIESVKKLKSTTLIIYYEILTKPLFQNFDININIKICILHLHSFCHRLTDWHTCEYRRIQQQQKMAKPTTNIKVFIKPRPLLSFPGRLCLNVM